MYWRILPGNFIFPLPLGKQNSKIPSRLPSAERDTGKFPVLMKNIILLICLSFSFSFVSCVDAASFLFVVIFLFVLLHSLLFHNKTKTVVEAKLKYILLVSYWRISSFFMFSHFPLTSTRTVLFFLFWKKNFFITTVTSAATTIIIAFFTPFPLLLPFSVFIAFVNVVLSSQLY